MRRVLREAGLPLSDEEDEEDDNDRCVLDEEGWQEAARCVIRAEEMCSDRVC